MDHVSMISLVILCFAVGVIDGKTQNERIVGGADAAPNQFPWQCELFNKEDNTVFCGCSIISQYWVLTAAHCLRKIDDTLSTDTDIDLNNLQIIMGVVDLLSSSRITKDVALARMHPSYTWEVLSLTRVDLAWIKLTIPLSFDTPRVQPIELVSINEPSYYPPASIGRIATVSGWGSLGGTLGHPTILQTVDVPILDNAVCNQRLNETGRLPIISDGGICAAGLMKDSCGGDSGSSLTLDIGQGRKQIGVVSYGTGPVCGAVDDYGVYVRIGVFKDYIQEHMDEPLLAGLGQQNSGAASLIAIPILTILVVSLTL